MKKYLLYIATALVFCSCEDIVNIKVNDSVKQLSVDAWLTDELKEQKIVLTISQSYFDNTQTVPALSAKVVVYGPDSTAYPFIDKNNTGVYTYTPTSAFLKLNQKAALYIKYDSEEYYSISQLNRVPKIDSIRYEDYTLPIKPAKGSQKGFLAQFYATDPTGPDDTYLIRYYKNDTLHFGPSEITLAYDAGFSPGSKSDGLLFILPIRQAINQREVWQNNDKLKVELFSIPLDAYYFISLVKTESNNGGLFATPLTNIPSNIQNVNSQSTKKALGLFFVSKVSRLETIIDKNLAKPKGSL